MPRPGPGSASEGEAPDTLRRSYRHRWLLLLPFIWQIGLAPMANDVAARPLGLPFPMVWQMLGILVATAVIAIVFSIDRKQESRLASDEEPGR
jgi:hypothetical protein